MPESEGKPDGLTIDAEGFVWSAHWDGWCVTRYDPDGHVERVINLPVPRPTSCVFGGADLQTLFVTSARIRLSAAQIADAPDVRQRLCHRHRHQGTARKRLRRLRQNSKGNATDMARLELHQIRKSFGTVDDPEGNRPDVEDGEFTAFVGPSGCGKSTLLRLICGLDEITSGEMVIDGKIVNDVPPAKRGIAMVFQSYALYPHMSVATTWATR